MKFLFPADFIPQLRRNVHETALAYARADFNNRSATAP
jgi:hypothetical protein